MVHIFLGCNKPSHQAVISQWLQTCDCERCEVFPCLRVQSPPVMRSPLVFLLELLDLLQSCPRKHTHTHTTKTLVTMNEWMNMSISRAVYKSLTPGRAGPGPGAPRAAGSAGPGPRVAAVPPSGSGARSCTDVAGSSWLVWRVEPGRQMRPKHILTSCCSTKKMQKCELIFKGNTPLDFYELNPYFSYRHFSAIVFECIYFRSPKMCSLNKCKRKQMQKLLFLSQGVLSYRTEITQLSNQKSSSTHREERAANLLFLLRHLQVKCCNVLCMLTLLIQRLLPVKHRPHRVDWGKAEKIPIAIL